MSRFFIVCLILVSWACTSEDKDTQPLDPTEDDTAQLNAALERYVQGYLAYQRTQVRAGEAVGSCTAGSLSIGLQDSIIQVINYFRRECYLPEVSLNTANQAACQQAALMIGANGGSTRPDPPATWLCYTPAGASIMASGNTLSGREGTEAILSWMLDEGVSNTATPNRRRILYTRAGSFGTGGNAQATTLWTQDSSGNQTNLPPFIAYPPERFFPSPLVPKRWSFSIPGADFGSAVVSMSNRLNGQSIVVQKNILNNQVGDATLTWEVGSLPLPPPAGFIPYTVQIENVLIDGQARRYSYT
ncbi:MAG: CAP domain-containing protein, partial [Sphingobacteriia bacterium]